MLVEIESRTKTEITKIADEYENRSTEELLLWAIGRFAPKLAMTSSFGAEGVVLIDVLSRVAPAALREIPVIYLDTGFHFPETEQLKEQMRERYALNLVEAGAELTVAEQARIYGEKLYERDSDMCCRLRKVEPLAGAMHGYDAWLAALRRDQSPSRAGIPRVEWNAKRRMFKVNPLAAWTRADVWNYIARHALPYNRLYDEGYASIGCAPCTRPVGAHEHERNGRWSGQGKLECGIHL
ncbi:MAG: phosphoadenylyl-sulfate reductase [Blastocatellia bacterium]